jgi:hypothetical protein
MQAIKENCKTIASYQAQFHRRWNHLNDPHVRALAWLLDAPDLLNPHALRWQGKIATLSANASKDAGSWLAALNQAPDALHDYLDVQPFMRLGRYAEKLLAFYFQHLGILVAHGVQVQAGKGNTIGEFDFLLRTDVALVHWEFATKFYLLEATGERQQADYFVGPNLADTLGAKMHKILSRQLLLAQHPAAQFHLPEPVESAQALIKGWLFYHDDDVPAGALGISENHCRGFWCAMSELDRLPQQQRYVVLPRLSWLAPAKVRIDQSLCRQSLQCMAANHFEHDTMPLLMAVVEPQDDFAIETNRGFIVPDNWRSRAEERLQVR